MGKLFVSSYQVFPVLGQPNMEAFARVVVSDQVQLTGIKIMSCNSVRTVVYPEIQPGVDYFTLMPGVLRDTANKLLLGTYGVSLPSKNPKATALKITDMRVERLAKPSGKTQAFVSCVLEGQIVLRGMRVVLGVNGLFLAHPNDPGYRGEDYRSLYYPLTRELRDAIETRALAMYSNEYTGDDSYNSN